MKHDDSEGKSHTTPMESSIIRQGEQEGSGEGYLGTAHALPSGPRGQTGPQRGKIWRDAPGICDLTSALCESLSDGRRRFLRALLLPLRSESLGFIKEIWLAGHRVAEQRGAHWRWSLNGR